MSDSGNDQDDTARSAGNSEFAPMVFAGLRLSGVFVILLILMAALYALPGFARGETVGNATVSIGFLLVAPFCIGAIASLVADPAGENSATFHALWTPLALLLLAVGVGIFFLREGMICVIMLAPLWMAMLSAGGYMVHSFHKQFHRRNRMNAALFASLAALFSVAGPEPLSSVQTYRFEQTIIINATPEEIWPHLESLSRIEPSEGRWTFTQDVLGVPRPVSAFLEKTHSGEVRFAEWENGVRFEEHITRNEPGRAMEWNFVFPDPTLHHHVDQHIDPNGEQLKVHAGGYRLDRLANGRTRLALHTTLSLNTQMNYYPAFWAQLMLGDIQANILEIVRDRSEASKSESHAFTVHVPG